MPTGERKKFSEWAPEVAAPFILEKEGCELTAYKCPAGVWTIGAGHTEGVHEGDTITRDEALEMLVADLQEFAQKIAKGVKTPCTRGQYVAMMSLAYNIGVSAFLRSSVLRLHNAGAPTQAAESFLLWKFAGGRPILLPRRKAERKEYLK
jgi:lysozyme